MGNFFPNLTVALIVLKLLGEIDWSWTQVTAPMWVMFLILFVIKLQESGAWNGD